MLEEKISVDYARRKYGVVIDERTMTIVPDETVKLRASDQAAHITAPPLPRHTPPNR